MFLHLSVSHFVYRGSACLGQTPPFGQTHLRQTPPSRHLPGKIPPRQTSPEAVRILLECILVKNKLANYCL